MKRSLAAAGITLVLSVGVLLFMVLSVRVGPVRNSHNLTLARMAALNAATQSFIADNNYPSAIDLPKFFDALRGYPLGGSEKVYIELTQLEVNTKGELLDGWDHPFVWEAHPPQGQLAIWSRGEKQKFTREEAKERDLYEVLIE